MSTTDRRELTDDLGILLRAALPALQAGIWTALPAKISKVNPGAGTCECNPTIQLKQQSSAGATQWVDFPTLVDCPIIFPSGGGFTLTFPLAVDDEVLVVFASRCIDAWFASGENGIQNELRMHDPSDGFVICGPRSYPNRLADVSTTDVVLRSDDGLTSLTVGADQSVTVVAPAHATVTAPAIALNGNVTIVGSLVVSGIVEALDLETSVLGATVSFNKHLHGNVTYGNHQTGIPQPPL